jgi:hypothetical protein
MEALASPVATSTKNNLEPSPQTDDGAMVVGATPTDTTTKINEAAISATDDGGVDATKSTKHIRAPSPPPDDGAVEALARPTAISTNINAAADDKSSKSTAAGRPPAVGVKNFLTANPLVDGESTLAVPVAKKTTRVNNLDESKGQVSITRPERKGNLKNDDDYKTGETGDPWDKFALSEINDQYYAVAVEKKQHIFGIYADVRKFKKEIEGVPTSLYESCNSYAQARKYLEDYLHQQKGDHLMEITNVALAALKKKHILGYEDLTQKQQEHARTLPKGIYVENITSQMQMLRIATTISHTVQTDALSDIDIDSRPAIHREPKNPHPTHVQKNTKSPQQNFMFGQKFLSDQAEGNTNELYIPSE